MSNYTWEVLKKTALNRQFELNVFENVKEKKIGKYIIGCIDEYGYVRRSNQEICDDLIFKENIAAEETEVESIIQLVQNFDPSGIGARDLKECLLLQLKRKAQTKEERVKEIEANLKERSLLANSIAVRQNDPEFANRMIDLPFMDPYESKYTARKNKELTGSPCLTPVDITSASKRRLRKQTIPLDMRWRFVISLLICLGSFILLRTQKRYLRDNDGKAEAISRAMTPLLG